MITATDASREYSVYDVVERRPLPLRERPLIVMECSVIAERYLGLGYTDAALDLMLALKARALRHWWGLHPTVAQLAFQPATGSRVLSGAGGVSQ